MAVKYSEAIRVARSLIGTPYPTKENGYKGLDCINLIKKVIRTATGGVQGYTTAGTNDLWDSIHSSAKYRDLTERHEGLDGIPAGALPFKRYGADGEDHVGIATGEGTVIHSSSVGGRGVVETPLTAAEGWDCWGVHRYIEVAGGAAEGQETAVVSYKMQVALADEKSTLNVRNEPSKAGERIGKVGHGAIVTVQAEYDNGWKFISYGDSGSGYVDGSYLAAYEEPEVEQTPEAESTVTIIDSVGHAFKPVGDWRVLIGSVD